MVEGQGAIRDLARVGAEVWVGLDLHTATRASMCAAMMRFATLCNRSLPGEMSTLAPDPFVGDTQAAAQHLE